MINRKKCFILILTITLNSFASGSQCVDLFESQLATQKLVDGRKQYNPESTEKLLYLYLLIVNGRRLDEAKFLLDQGADPNALQLNGWPAINAAAYYGRTNVVALLLQYGTRSDIKSSYDDKNLDALGWAKLQDKSEVTEMLEKYYQKKQQL